MVSIVLRRSIADFYLRSPHSGVELKKAIVDCKPVEPPPCCFGCQEPLGKEYYQDVPVEFFHRSLITPPEGVTKMININLCNECHGKRKNAVHS